MENREKIIKYHLDFEKQSDKEFLNAVEELKKSGKRLSRKQTESFLRRARNIVYKK
jgi:hypothetical protein